MSATATHAPTATTTRQFCTFHVGSLFMGVDVLEVQEVIRHQEMTRVPLSPPEVKGLINLRGQIVTAIDLRTRLSLPPREANPDDPDDRPLNVVVRTRDGAVSLLVDEIGDVLEVDAAALAAPPATLPRTTADVIDGIFQLDHRLLLILNTAAVIGPTG